jgi:hypothetical protein
MIAPGLRPRPGKWADSGIIGGAPAAAIRLLRVKPGKHSPAQQNAASSSAAC